MIPIAIAWIRTNEDINDIATIILASAGHGACMPFKNRVLYQWLARIVGARVRCVGSEIKIDALMFGRVCEVISLVCISATSMLVAAKYGLFAQALFVTSGFAISLSKSRIKCDHLALFLAFLSTMLPTWLAIPILVVAGLAHERAPVFAALWSFNPWLLLGLAPYPVVHMLTKSASPFSYEKNVMNNPIASASGVLKTAFLSSLVMPIGLMWFGVDGSHVLLLVVTYAQLFIAIDRNRLIGWAVPGLVGSAAVALSGLPSVPIVILNLLVSSYWADRPQFSCCTCDGAVDTIGKIIKREFSR